MDAQPLITEIQDAEQRAQLYATLRTVLPGFFGEYAFVKIAAMGRGTSGELSIIR